MRCVLFSLFAIGWCFSSNAIGSDVQLYANSSVKSDSLSQSELRLIFAGRTQYWPNGEKITVYVLPSNNAIHQDFCRDILGMYPYQLERIWHQVTYSGQGDAPVEIDTVSELINAVANTPGAIGYGNIASINNKAINEIQMDVPL